MIIHFGFEIIVQRMYHLDIIHNTFDHVSSTFHTQNVFYFLFDDFVKWYLYAMSVGENFLYGNYHSIEILKWGHTKNRLIEIRVTYILWMHIVSDIISLSHALSLNNNNGKDGNDESDVSNPIWINGIAGR